MVVIEDACRDIESRLDERNASDLQRNRRLARCRRRHRLGRQSKPCRIERTMIFPSRCRAICRLMRRTFIARRSTMPLRRTPVIHARKEAAHRIAWGAVKRSYVKIGNRWVSRTK